MSTRFTIAHEFDCDPATYWDIFWNEDFNREQYQRMKCGRTLLMIRDEEKVRYRDQEVRPERELPGALKKFMSGALKYIEHGVFTKPAGPLNVNIEVPALGSRFEMKALYAVTDLGAGRCKREFSGDCHVKIPLVGGAAEKSIISNMKETYDMAAKVHAEWIAKRRQNV